jgi:hypothetical protein
MLDDKIRKVDVESISRGKFSMRMLQKHIKTGNLLNKCPAWFAACIETGKLVIKTDPESNTDLKCLF